MQKTEANIQPFDLTVSGKRVHVWTGGVGGPALLLLHSAWGDAEMSWGPVWNDLSRSFTIIAPDMPGFGSSGPLPAPSLAANAVLLRDLLDSRKADRVTVVGNSFGAAVAIEFASTFPERTHHLALVNGGFVPVVPGFIKKFLRLQFLERRFRSLMRNMTYSDKAFAKAFPNQEKLRKGFFERIRANEEKQSRTVFDAFMNQTKRQKTPSVPATIIWGTGDRLATMKQVGLVGKWSVQPKIVFIEGAGHMPQIEEPQKFAEAMKKIAGIS